MNLTTFKIGKKEFVVVPKREYDMLTRIERDAKDAQIAEKAMAAIRAGTLKTIPFDELKRKLGL